VSEALDPALQQQLPGTEGPPTFSLLAALHFVVESGTVAQQQIKAELLDPRGHVLGSLAGTVEALMAQGDRDVRWTDPSGKAAVAKASMVVIVKALPPQ